MTKKLHRHAAHTCHNKCNRGNRLNQHRKNPFPISLGNLIRIAIGKLRAIALLNKSQQVR
ncbi:MAG: hypothetical protein ACBR50_10865 [Microcoleus sp.]